MSDRPSKALSFWQPWADLVLPVEPEGPVPKWIETRPQPPAGGDFRAPAGGRYYSGCALRMGERFLVHAAKRRIDRDGAVVARAAGRLGPFHFMAVIGEAQLVNAVPMVTRPSPRRDALVLADDGRRLVLVQHSGDGVDEQDVTDQLPFGFFAPGRWAWLLADPVRYERALQVPGRQGVFRVHPG